MFSAGYTSAPQVVLASGPWSLSTFHHTQQLAPHLESLRGSEHLGGASSWCHPSRGLQRAVSQCRPTPRPRSSVGATVSGCPAQCWVAALGRWYCRLLLLLLFLVPGSGTTCESTFELPDNAKQCFHEDITQGTKCTLQFQVVTGGHCGRLEDPDGNVLYKEMKKQYDSYTFTASKNGTYKFCFSKEFFTFTHKNVYFDFQVGEDPPLFPGENRVRTLTQRQSVCVSIHEALKSVIDYQTHV